MNGLKIPPNAIVLNGFKYFFSSEESHHDKVWIRKSLTNEIK